MKGNSSASTAARPSESERDELEWIDGKDEKYWNWFSDSAAAAALARKLRRTALASRLALGICDMND